MIYLITFGISLMFLALGLNIKNKMISKIVVILGISIPCILASVRAYSIGADTNLYIYPLYLIAKKMTFLPFVFNNSFMNDYLYLIVTFLCSRISSNVNSLLFMINFIIEISLLKAFRNIFDSNKKIIAGFFIYYMFMYNSSFNMARQSIALSIVCLALSYLLKKNKKMFFVFSIIAYFFHWSALTVFLIYFIYKVANLNNLEFEKKFYLGFLLCFSSFALIFILPYSAGFFSNFGYFGMRISNFISAFASESYTSNTTADTLFFGFFLSVMLIYKKNFSQNNKNFMFFLYILILGIIILQIGSFISYAFRISYYFIYPVIFLELPQNVVLFKKNKLNIYNMIVFLSFLFYWIFWNIVANYHGTYPFIWRM